MPFDGWGSRNANQEIVHEMWQRCLDNGDIYKMPGFFRIGWKLVKTEFKSLWFWWVFLMCFINQACRKWHTRKDYTGYYCVGCEAYLDDDEMDEGHICKIHQKECVLRSEENYFFRLSKYWGAVRQHIEENPDFILPTSRRSQVLVWLEEDNKRDFSISRASTSWGIPVPGDDSQAIPLLYPVSMTIPRRS